MSAVSLERALAAKASALQQFGHLDALVGVGVTRVDGDYAVKINLRAPADVEFPTHIDGVPVRVEITGPIKVR